MLQLGGIVARWLARGWRSPRRRCPAHALLPIQHWQTTSGARVYFVENHDLPMLDLERGVSRRRRLRPAREVRRREHDQPPAAARAPTA